MASLEKLVLTLRKRKQEASKLRLKAEKQLKELRSVERRSSSGLVSLDRKIESEREDSSDVSDILIQKTSQLESIERLVAAAKDRLNREKEALSDTEQQIEFAENPEEKKNAEIRLNSIKDNIVDLEYEIKSRQKTAKKISDEVEKNTEIQSRISSKIKKQSQSKPSLRESMTSSHKQAEKFEKEFERRLKSEQIAKNSLDKAWSKLQELRAKKKKSSQKKRTAKKTATKKKAPKRKVAKKASKKPRSKK